MFCPKLMEKLWSQLEILDFFYDILCKIMRSKVYIICCFPLKIRPWFLQSLKHYIFLAFGITRYLHYGRIIDKLNKSCAIALFSVNLRITKNGTIVEKRGILCLPYLLNEFGDLAFFLCFYYLHIINFKREKSRRFLM